MNRKDTSSSSGKIFAKPTKEWVLPEKVKPGRKVSLAEPDDKRQSQNRQSQRAHRARKTDYIQTLESRLRQYEADEIHSNVRLQEVARALKNDNERLKKEVGELRCAIEGMMKEREDWKVETTRLSSVVSDRKPGLKEGTPSYSLGAKTMEDGIGDPISPRRRSSAGGPSRSAISNLLNKTDPPSRSRPVIDCPICAEPDPDCPCQRPSTDMASASGNPSLVTLTLAAKAIEDHEAVIEPCGLCQSIDECVCHLERRDPVSLPTSTNDLGIRMTEIVQSDHGCGLCTEAAFCACKTGTSPVLSTHGFPAPSPNASLRSGGGVTAVALPLKRKRGTVKTSIWEILPAAPQKGAAVCSGDPEDCDACRNDTFGQEFCSNLLAGAGFPGGDDVRGSESEDTMTPDKAWKALKAHPNSKYTSLSLLADVVAGRSPPEVPSGIEAARDADGNPFKRPRYTVSSINGSGMNGKKAFTVKTSGLQDALRLLDEAAQA